MSDVTHSLIAHATSNEHKKISGGELGDQSGYELCACTWFDAGWTAVYAAQDPEKLERMAQFAEDAVTNGFFGYSQNRDYRERFIRQCKLHDFQPDLVNINRVCDCSTLIYGAVFAAYGVKYTTDYATPPTTEVFDGYLMNQFPKGTFVKYEKGDDYDLGPDNLARGYSLFKPGHIAIWI